MRAKEIDKEIEELNVKIDSANYDENGNPVDRMYVEGLEYLKDKLTEEKVNLPKKTLESLRELAYRAHSGTSFSPERRAESVVNDYSAELDLDVLSIKKQGANDGQVERYVNEYKSKLSAYLHSQSNVMSSMITGPARFPVESNRKKSNYADNHYNNFRLWRKKVLAAYDRFERKAKVVEAGGPLEIAKAKLIQLEETQELMKKVNKAHAAYLKNAQSLLNSDLTEYQQKLVITFVQEYSWIKHPFAPYQLTNNNATIISTRKRIAELETKETKAATGNKEIPFEGGKLILNYEIDRVQIQHDQKPDASVITNLKSNGFKWSPFYKVWQRQLTNNALFTVKHFLKIEF